MFQRNYKSFQWSKASASSKLHLNKQMNNLLILTCDNDFVIFNSHNLSLAHLCDFHCMTSVARSVVRILNYYYMLYFPRINNCFDNFQNCSSHFCVLQVYYFNKQPAMHTEKCKNCTSN